MKKIILSIVALVGFAFAGNAQDDDTTMMQTAKGKWLIEANTGNALLGNTGIYFSSQDGEYIYNIGLDGGYFVADDFAIKFGLGYGGDSETDLNGFSYRVGGKYYIASKFPISLDVTGSKIDNVDENPFWLGIGGGYAWFIGNSVAIEPGLRYNVSLNEDFSDKDIFQINIGFTVFL
ncbi:hypothetical protein [Kordia jejudonensis]|uniref:hypothetical protein n=1 Tax=Kordia jejudonensis TaxID=1348245 RepID=UPI00062925C7|nr:hypothetical protein [Kordia jejudonensis]